MIKLISELLKPEIPVFIVGSDKNSGKTTILSLLKDIQGDKNKKIGILTIGRDGENYDHVFNHSKPKLIVKPGDLFVTTFSGTKNTPAKLIFPLSYKNSGGMERLGIWCCESKGEIELTGPGIGEYLWDIISKTREAGADYIFVDGAIDRWTFASMGESKIILSCGFDGFNTVEKAIEWIKHKNILMNLPVSQKPEFELKDLKSEDQLKDVNEIFINGGFISETFKKLKPEKIKIVVQSPSHIFLKHNELKSIQDNLSVLSKPELIALFYNSREKYSPEKLLSKIEELNLKIPVFNAFYV
jgi:hypothetical protein